MDGSFYVLSPIYRINIIENPKPATAETELQTLLKQVLEVQREQLAILKAQQAAADTQARWRAFLARWADHFPEIGKATRQALPKIEQAYLELIQDLSERMSSEDDSIDSEFAMSEFLDRYGIKLSQLGALMSQLAPIVDAAPTERNA